MEDYHIEILEKLSVRTIEYLKNDINLDIVIDKNYTIDAVDFIDYHDISVLISLNKDMEGTVGMSVSKELSFEIAKSFLFGEPTQEEIDELSSEGIAETLNITLGNILQNLTLIKAGANVGISTPYIMTNKVNIVKKKNGKMFIVHLKYKNDTIILSYFI